MSDGPRVPVICAAEPSIDALRVFNANQWPPRSKGIIQSCSTELSVLNYTTKHIEALCRDAMALCEPNVRLLQSQWASAPWDVSKANYFAQVPEIHVYIEG